MTSPVNDDVMRGIRYLDGTVNFDKRPFLRQGGPGALLRFLRMLGECAFDAVIVPATVSTSFTSDLLAFATGAPVRIGPASIDGRENPSAFVYTHPVRLDWRGDPSRHQTLRNLDIAVPLGLPRPDLSLEMTLTEGEREEGRAFVNGLSTERRPVVAIHAGAGKAPNRWPAERFAAIAGALVESAGAALILTAGPMDDETTSILQNTLHARVYLLRNQPIRKVASILSEVDILISNDTGIMHVGAAAGTRVLSLFGPTDPGQWAPPGPQHRFLRGKGGSIETISTEEVLGAVMSMLSERTTTRRPVAP
jgi:ADP-heptose:LPS heptosyltransferase